MKHVIILLSLLTSSCAHNSINNHLRTAYSTCKDNIDNVYVVCENMEAAACVPEENVNFVPERNLVSIDFGSYEHINYVVYIPYDKCTFMFMDRE
jgi:hypothetical protein